MTSKPQIAAIRTTARSQLFRVEAVELRFNNGREAQYERLARNRPHRDAVIIIPLVDAHTLLLVREYAVGVEDYVLRLPQGMPLADESAIGTANRELMEEVGYAARRLREIGSLHLAPGFLPYRARVVLAEGLYPQQLAGDEPEPLEVIRWPIARLPELVAAGEITEAGTLAALFLAQPRMPARLSRPKTE